MDAMVIPVPAELKQLGEAFVAVIDRVLAARKATVGGKAPDYAAFERALQTDTAAIERAAHAPVLEALEVDRDRVAIDGKTYARVGRHEGTYYTCGGPVTVLRSLFREVGVRNGPTVDAVSLRAGVVGDGWLPQAARAMAHLVQQGTSREAVTSASELGRLPYSRSSFERVAHEVGAQYVQRHVEVEDTLIEAYEVPEAARSVSAALDRVSVPMEEPRARPQGRPKKGAPKRPIARNFRMAYAGTVTLHDENGEAMHTIRYGRMPAGDVEGLMAGMAGDVLVLLRKRPDLKVTTLSDGAAEMAHLLADHISNENIGLRIVRLVDLWHLLEKLGKAAVVVHGAEGAKAVLRRWRLRFLNRSLAHEEILVELQATGREDVAVGEARPVHEAITYLANNGDRMNYAAARRQGLPIGSGNVEATCKTLFDQRLKRAGARWKETSGEHIVQLRAAGLSDRWPAALDLTLRPLRRAVRVA